MFLYKKNNNEQGTYTTYDSLAVFITVSFCLLHVDVVIEDVAALTRTRAVRNLEGAVLTDTPALRLTQGGERTAATWTTRFHAEAIVERVFRTW